MYAALKHLHVACVVLSVAGFALRGALAFRDSPLLRRRWVKTLPHINDSLLLAAALGLAALSGQWPFVDAWLTAKVFGLIAYIVLGALALRPGIGGLKRGLAYAGALGVFSWIVSVALARNAAGFAAAAIG